MDVAGDFLLTADADGNVCCTVAKRFREIVDTKATEAQDESFLEEEVLEKPKFFHQRELKELKRGISWRTYWHITTPCGPCRTRPRATR